MQDRHPPMHSIVSLRRCNNHQHLHLHFLLLLPFPPLQPLPDSLLPSSNDVYPHRRFHHDETSAPLGTPNDVVLRRDRSPSRGACDTCAVVGRPRQFDDSAGFTPRALFPPASSRPLVSGKCFLTIRVLEIHPKREWRRELRGVTRSGWRIHTPWKFRWNVGIGRRGADRWDDE